MTTSSVLVIARRHTNPAVLGLLSVVIIQALGYGLIFDLNFFLRNLSVMGGLLMVLGDSFVKKSRMFAGLPSLDEKDRKMYIQLGGRVLLIFLFVGFVFAGEWSFGRVVVSLIGFVACVMVVVGFKAKLSAIILVLLLSVFNVLVNNFWTVSILTPKQLPGIVRPGRVDGSANMMTAPPPSPPQRLRQIRFLPDSQHYGWTVAVGQYGTGPVER
jgi:ER-derived vesicles protein